MNENSSHIAPCAHDISNISSPARRRSFRRVKALRQFLASFIAAILPVRVATKPSFYLHTHRTKNESVTKIFNMRSMPAVLVSLVALVLLAPHSAAASTALTLAGTVLTINVDAGETAVLTLAAGQLSVADTGHAVTADTNAQGTLGFAASASPNTSSDANLATDITKIVVTSNGAGGGTVALGGSGVLNANWDLTVDASLGSAGTFDVAGNQQTAATVHLVSGSIKDSIGAGALTSTNAFDAQSGTASARLAGGNGLTKSSGGSVTLAGVNTYSGATTISAGTLIADADAPSAANGAFGNSSVAIVLGDANTTLNNSSPSLLTGGAFTIGRPVTVANQATAGTYTIGGNTDNNSTYSGAVTINQPLTIAQVATTGTNALTFSGLVSGAKTLTLAGPGATILGTIAPFSGGVSIVGATSGGGLDVKSGAGSITIQNSTIANNNTSANGAGLNVEQGYANSLTLVNDTIDGNGKTTTPVNGGGIFFGSGTLSITNCTIANNMASYGGGIFFAAGTRTLTNTIVAKNTATNSDNDILGSVNPASSFNLIGDGTGLGGSINDGTNGNQVGNSTTSIDPLLAPLGNYGGPTQTDALLSGSRAQDRGTAIGAPSVDQRGVSRPQPPPGGSFDIGAFEVQVIPLTSVGSRMTHGSAGTFDINLPLTGTRGVECRSSASLGAGKYVVVFTFVNNVTSCGTASIGTVSGPTFNTCTVSLTGVANQQYTTVTLNNVVDSQGNRGDVATTMGVLIGDVNATGLVDGNDVSLVQGHTRQTANSINFRLDINATGLIDGNDVSLVQSKTRSSLPSPP